MVPPMSARELPASECRKLVSPNIFRFASTEETAPLSGIASQERALTALSFGLDIRQPRFHVVVVGASGTGRTFCARSVAKRIARDRPTPDDMLLMPNPRRPSEPTVLSLAPGEGRPFVDAMEELYTKLIDAVRGASEGERYKQARAKIRRRVTTEESRLEEVLKSAAKELGLELTRSEDEIQITSVDENAGPPNSEALQAIAGSIEEFESRLATVQDEADAELRGVIQHLLAEGVKGCFSPVRSRFSTSEAIVSFLGDVETVVTRELRRMVDEPRGEEAPTLSRGLVIPTLLTEHKPSSGAPVVEVPYPTLSALFGRTYAPPDSDFPPEPGFAVAGALHEANGGFLILPASSLPFTSRSIVSSTPSFLAIAGTRSLATTNCLSPKPLT